MKKMIILSWFLAVILAGCGGINPGSPKISITKNVYIIDSDNADIGYSTESSTSNIAEITQDLKDLIDLSLEPKIK